MHIGIVGCCHGEVDKALEVIDEIEKRRNVKVDLILCCGDFQSLRNAADMRCMACPIKYQAMHDFHRYYSGEKVMKIPFIFVGGNHEGSNFLQELPYGGWVAPNIFYMGNCNVIKVKGIRIGGISGIYKGYNYMRGRYECPPYDQSTVRSVYHYRNIDVFRLRQVSRKVDIFLSHDWPLGIEAFGDLEKLFRAKPNFREEVDQNILGSPPLLSILEKLKPSYWFAAHLHVKFSSIYPHSSSESKDNADNVEENVPTTGANEVQFNDNQDSDPKNLKSPQTPQKSQQVTKFLALSKVVPKQQFLQILDIPVDENNLDEPILQFDEEWIAVLRATNSLVSASRGKCFMPSINSEKYMPTEKDIRDSRNLINDYGKEPAGFSRTGPIYANCRTPCPVKLMDNPQTQKFCQVFQLTDPCVLSSQQRQENDADMDTDHNFSMFGDETFSADNDSMNMSDRSYNVSASFLDSSNPEEIQLEFEDQEDDSSSFQREESIPISSTPRSDNVALISRNRSRLTLPPPKNSDVKVNDPENPDPTLRISFVDSNEGREPHESETTATDSVQPQPSSFFIDTKGRSDVKTKMCGNP